jgi:hypothetical protein
VDWDGGAGAATPDPQCEGHGYAGEAPPGACGLGTELALLLPAIAALRRRRAARG